MPTLRTIGVYGFDRDSFLAALTEAEVGLLLDVRQRRGVRGSKYAWANANRLHEVLDPVDLEPLVIGSATHRRLCSASSGPEACHRSLIAERLSRELGFEVEDLRP